MDTQSLRDHLAQLRTELGASASVDQETRALLGDIMRDIVRLTESPDAGAQALPGGAPAERLEGIAVWFRVGAWMSTDKVARKRKTPLSNGV
jgi:hypothetical protein